jgi:hypothetical protein
LIEAAIAAFGAEVMRGRTTLIVLTTLVVGIAAGRLSAIDRHRRPARA